MSSLSSPRTQRAFAFSGAGANLIATYALLLLPILLGANQQETLAFTIAVVSVQAGQSAVVQVGRPPARDARVSIVVGIFVLSVVELIHAFLVLSWADIAYSAGIAIAGMFFGMGVGALANHRLSAGRTAHYQMLILTRTTIWGVVVWVLGWTWGVAPMISTIFAWVVVLISVLWDPGANGHYGRRGFSVWFGAVAGLVYRNDVSIVRALALGALFDFWNAALIVYALSQALLGFVAVNEIYSRRAKVQLWMTRARELTLATISLAALPLIFIAVLLLESFDSTTAKMIQVGALILAGSIVAVQATLAHIAGRSWMVYLAGSCGFGALALAAWGGWAPGSAMALELLTSGILVGISFVLLRKTG